jgi:hypothetical protein
MHFSPNSMDRTRPRPWLRQKMAVMGLERNKGTARAAKAEETKAPGSTRRPRAERAIHLRVQLQALQGSSIEALAPTNQKSGERERTSL